MPKTMLRDSDLPDYCSDECNPGPTCPLCRKGFSPYAIDTPSVFGRLFHHACLRDLIDRATAS